MDEAATRQEAGATGRQWMLAEEAAPIALMATIWADTAGLHDSLADTEDLTAFCDAVAIDRGGARATAAELRAARQLRDALRRLAAEVTGDDRPEAASATAELETAVGDLNEVLTHLPAPRIALAADGRLRAASTSGPSAITTGLAHVAADAITLLTGPDADKLRACYAPGCVLYFVKTHPRREWCSVTCGNRVRAARHYDKVRSAR